MQWFEDVRQSAQESLQGFPLVAELLNSGGEAQISPRYMLGQPTNSQTNSASVPPNKAFALQNRISTMSRSPSNGQNSYMMKHVEYLESAP